MELCPEASFGVLHNLFIDQKRREASEQKRNARLAEARASLIAEGEQEQAVYLAEVAARFAAGYSTPRCAGN